MNFIFKKFKKKKKNIIFKMKKNYIVNIYIYLLFILI